MNEVQESSNRVDPKMIESRVSTGQLLLIVILVLMLFMGPVVLLKQIYPKGIWQILPVVVTLVAVEGAWTTRWLGHAPRGLNLTIYRLAEVISLALVVTFVYWLSTSGNLRDQMVRNFLEAPLSIFDAGLVVILMLCLMAWEWSNQLICIFSRLAMSQEEITFFTTPSPERQEKGMALVVPVYRNRLYHGFIRHWAVGGLILATFSMLATVELTNTNLEAIQTLNFRVVTRLGLPSNLLLALMIYFSAGFWLASHARLAVMQARWVAGGIEIDSALRSKWRRQLLAIIMGVGLLAAFLPIGSTFAISEIIQALLGYMLVALSFLFGLIPFLLAWLLSLISKSTPTAEPLPTDNLPPIVPGLENSEPILSIPPAVFEGLFIVTAIVFTLIATVYFLRYRSLKIELTWFVESWSRLIIQLHSLWRRLSKSSSELVDFMKTRLEQAALKDRENLVSWRIPPMGDKTPRGRIRYYYLSLLYHAEKHGVSRPPGDTPLEHEKNLIFSWPEAGEEIRDLTRLFLKARYGRQPLTSQSTHEAKDLFRRLRKVLRKSGNPDSLSQISSPESPNSSEIV